MFLCNIRRFCYLNGGQKEKYFFRCRMIFMNLLDIYITVCRIIFLIIKLNRNILLLNCRKLFRIWQMLKSLIGIACVLSNHGNFIGGMTKTKSSVGKSRMPVWIRTKKFMKVRGIVKLILRIFQPLNLSYERKGDGVNPPPFLFGFEKWKNCTLSILLERLFFCCRLN